jgi:hypothetical protein
MTLHPLTPGLLASAAMRADHAVFMPDVDWGPAFAMLPWNERVPAGLESARQAYDMAVRRRLSDLQVLEEFEGRGFYSPDREDHYLAVLDGFPGMRALAEEIAARPAD